jgi:hypothetical protein
MDGLVATNAVGSPLDRPFDLKWLEWTVWWRPTQLDRPLTVPIHEK